jgi:2'-5' RNA ligase
LATDQVEQLWQELSAELGIQGVPSIPIPHCSYHVASEYDEDMLKLRLYEFAAQCSVFTVTTSGLGVFTGAKPVLYVPIVRSPQLSALHAQIWHLGQAHSISGQAYYHPDQWLPHITIAQGELEPAHLPAILRLWGERSFQWTLAVNNLALLATVDQPPALRQRFAFPVSSL